MAVYRVSYAVIHGETCPDVYQDFDKFFLHILGSAEQKNTCKVGNMEWLVDYDGENKELQEVMLHNFDAMYSKHKQLRLEYCVSSQVFKDNLVVYKVDSDKATEILHWLNEHMDS